MSNFDIVKSRDDQYVLNSYSRFPVALTSGKGARAIDPDGREYIDLTSGIGVNSLGFCDDDWAAAVALQASKLQHVSNLFYSEPCGEVAKKLCEKTGMACVFFANSGAESNEGAIKAARKYSFDKYGLGRSKIVTLVNSFHGRTVTTLAATGQEVFHNYFYPFTEGFSYAPANDLSEIDLTGAAAVMIELVQGEGGVLALDKDYVKSLAKLCESKDVLLIVDEVQTGIGRTGSLFAFQQYGILPDIVTAAKGLGGGLPIGAVLFSEKTKHVLGAGMHATTFGGNPVVCAGASVVLDKLTDDFLQAVTKKGDYIRSRLKAMPHVVETSGLGMMIGASIEGAMASDVVKAGIEEGVLALTAKGKLRLLPPLTITAEELDEGLNALERALLRV